MLFHSSFLDYGIFWVFFGLYWHVGVRNLGMTYPVFFSLLYSQKSGLMEEYPVEDRKTLVQVLLRVFFFLLCFFLARIVILRHFWAQMGVNESQTEVYCIIAMDMGFYIIFDLGNGMSWWKC